MAVITRAMLRKIQQSNSDLVIDSDEIRGLNADHLSSDEDTEEWKKISRNNKIERSGKESPLNKGIGTVISFLKLKDDERRIFFINKIGKTCCRKCGTEGKWVRIKKDPKSGSWIWSCGALTSNEGCSRTITQGVLFKNSLGELDLKEFKKGLPTDAYKQLTSMDIRPIANPAKSVKRPPVILQETPSGPQEPSKKQATDEPDGTTREAAKKWADSVKQLIDAAISLARQATKLEEVQAAFDVLEKAKIFLNKANALTEIEQVRTVNLGQVKLEQVGRTLK